VPVAFFCDYGIIQRMIKNTQQNYGSVAKTLHWLMFVLIAGLLIVGLIMTDMENSPDKFRIYGLHKSIGIVVLMLAAVRLMWKFINPAPILPTSMRAIEKLAAHAGHWILYGLMFAMPLSGWMMSSAAGFSVSVFGLFTLPDLVSADKELAHDLKELHELLGNGIMVMVVLHAAAALLHHFYHKDNVLIRMLPRKR
jgi:cytochrome b561